MKFCEKEKDCPIYLIHKELNGHYQRLIDELLGKYYYNYGKVIQTSYIKYSKMYLTKSTYHQMELFKNSLDYNTSP